MWGWVKPSKCQAAGERRRGTGCDYGPEAFDYKGKEGHRLLQVAPRDADWHESHVAQSQDVGVLDRLVTLSLPRIRDFRGVSPKSFDGRGNYTLGLKEQFIFPEIKYDEVASIHGMDITIVTTARTNDEGRALLKHLGMPFRA